MNKEMICLEFVFDNVSRSNLWKHISTSYGLSTWFADEVSVDNNIYTFMWNNDKQSARVEIVKPKESIRFVWNDDEENSEYFIELTIKTLELTGTTSLQIKDFATSEDKDDTINLWENQIETLKRVIGL